MVSSRTAANSDLMLPLKIFFVDYKSQAGWQSKEKKHILY